MIFDESLHYRFVAYTQAKGSAACVNLVFSCAFLTASGVQLEASRTEDVQVN